MQIAERWIAVMVDVCVNVCALVRILISDLNVDILKFFETKLKFWAAAYSVN